VRELADRETADMQRLTDQPGLDRILAAEIVSRLLTTTTGALRLLQGVDTAALPEAIVLLATTQGSQHADPIIRGLFERFLPEERRTKRLGTQVHPEAILALPGDSVRGQALFVDGVGIQCRNCHQVGTAGKSVGPRLDDIGARYSRTQLLEHILDPSRRIDTPWVNYTLVTTGGRVLTGLLVQRTGESVTLRDPQGQDHGIATSEIEELLAQQKSLMPELLFQDMTAEQLADLLAFLVILRGEEGGATQ
jgi:putative heme-binding domain-containing protein